MNHVHNIKLAKIGYWEGKYPIFVYICKCGYIEVRKHKLREKKVGLV